jgi:hypothetical protein
MNKVTWGDLQNATHKELKKVYKLDDRQLENQVRRHLDGATAKERRDMYGNVWTNKAK